MSSSVIDSLFLTTNSFIASPDFSEGIPIAAVSRIPSILATTPSISFGKTKFIYEEETEKVLSIGIVGPNAGDLIGEAALAIEMGAIVEDISLTIHPHPTLSETFANSAEMLSKTITDLYIKK